MTPEEVTHEVRRLEITTRHLVRDIMAGEYSSAFRGRGVEFAEVREYQPGDDIRTIDWNVTARLGSAYVKRFLEERELTILFVADVSASGGFGTRRRTKGELAIEVAAVLALAAARNNDRVGVAFATDRVEQYRRAGQGSPAGAPRHQRSLSYRAPLAGHGPGPRAHRAGAGAAPPRGHLPALRLPGHRVRPRPGPPGPAPRRDRGPGRPIRASASCPTWDW